MQSFLWLHISAYIPLEHYDELFASLPACDFIIIFNFVCLGLTLSFSRMWESEIVAIWAFGIVVIMKWALEALCWQGEEGIE